jgi:glutamine---fructose-6-phosphate transaminase (isomerizing)
MCGIFGYIGKNTDTAETVLDGLKLMEYRGYDSWGVAVRDGETLLVDKHIGKIGTATVNLPKSTLGIGHTRWATHGGVTDTNAHPHLDCTKQIAVVHNGIIENYAELKQELLLKGHRFISETDTEVVPHLIEENLKTHNFSESVRLAFNRFTGMNAVVVCHTTSNEIIAAKTGSPLIAGIGDDGFYISSDVAGIIKHTRTVLFLQDKDMVILGNDLNLIGLVDGVEKEKRIETVDWKIEDAEVGDYPHFLIKEIYEQGKVIRNIAKNYDDQILDVAEIIDEAYGTFFIAAGTAFYACLAGTYLFSVNAKKHVNAAVASEFNYLEDFLTEKSLIIAISQSGETIDVIEPLQRAKEKGSKIAGLVNTLGSTLFRMADYKLLLGAGPEKAVASTKAYIAQSSLLFLISHALSGNLEQGKAQLLQTADEIDRLLEDSQIQILKQLTKTFTDVQHTYTLGRGISYPSALEASLKLKETTYIHTEGFAGGELKHGTMALITQGTPVIVFAPNDETYEAILSNAMEVRSRGATVIGVSPKNSEIFDHWIEVKDVGQASFIAQIVPIQLLSYFIAVEKNLDPDKPRNLAKSVTVK